MAFLTDSQIEAIKTAYIDNVDYDDGAGDVTKARNFKNACRKLLMIQPQMAMHFAMGGNHQVQIDTKLVENQLKQVTSWLQVFDSAISDASPNSIQLVLDEFRG